MHEANSQRVPEGEHGGGGGGGGQSVRAGLTRHSGVEGHVRQPSQRGVLASGHGDEAGAERLQGRKDGVQFRRFAGVGNGDDHVVAAQAPQIAVRTFHGMQEKGGGSGRGKGGGKLAAYEPRLADAGHDHAPRTGGQRPQGEDQRRFLGRGGSEALAHGGEPGYFRSQHILRQRDERGGCRRDGRVGHGKTSLRRALRRCKKEEKREREEAGLRIEKLGPGGKRGTRGSVPFSRFS